MVSENKINWSYLCLNPNAIEFIKNIDKKDWYYLKKYSSVRIFELDYETMYEDLMKEVMKPSRVFKYQNYDYIEDLFGCDL